jgi:hypothetical protein
VSPADKRDAFLSPYYGWVIERLFNAIHAAPGAGEVAEIPRYEANRAPGSTAEVDFWTSKEVREVVHCHLNYAVADTLRWEESAAYYLWIGIRWWTLSSRTRGFTSRSRICTTARCTTTFLISSCA